MLDQSTRAAILKLQTTGQLLTLWVGKVAQDSLAQSPIRSAGAQPGAFDGACGEGDSTRLW